MIINLSMLKENLKKYFNNEVLIYYLIYLILIYFFVQIRSNVNSDNLNFLTYYNQYFSSMIITLGFISSYRFNFAKLSAYKNDLVTQNNSVTKPRIFDIIYLVLIASLCIAILYVVCYLFFCYSFGVNPQFSKFITSFLKVSVYYFLVSSMAIFFSIVFKKIINAIIVFVLFYFLDDLLFEKLRLESPLSSMRNILYEEGIRFTENLVAISIILLTIAIIWIYNYYWYKVKLHAL